MQHIIKIILFLSINSVGFGGTLELENNDDGTWNIKYVSEVDIGGFQFNVDGATVNSGSGGDMASYGLFGSAAGSTFLAFSFTGGTIPAGCGTLVNLSLSGDATGLSNIIVSDATGSQLYFEYYEGSDEAVLGCTDMNACNYNPNATEDDGSCLENDCAGECGGSAVLDACGICNGPGSIYECGCADIPDGDCDCSGHVLDACGVCGGIGVDTDEDGICDNIDDCIGLLD